MTKAYQSIDRRAAYYPSLIVDYIYVLMSCQFYPQALTIIENEKPFLNDYADFNFVSALLYVDLILQNPQKYIGYFNEIEKRYLRCLEIGEETKYSSVEGTGSYSDLYDLGVFYEMTGKIQKARDCYKCSCQYGYASAIERLNKIK